MASIELKRFGVDSGNTENYKKQRVDGEDVRTRAVGVPMLCHMEEGSCTLLVVWGFSDGDLFGRCQAASPSTALAACRLGP